MSEDGRKIQTSRYKTGKLERCTAWRVQLIVLYCVLRVAKRADLKKLTSENLCEVLHIHNAV